MDHTRRQNSYTSAPEFKFILVLIIEQNDIFIVTFVGKMDNPFT